MTEIRVPELGDGIEAANLQIWLVHEGHTVEKGTELAEMATEKAVFNIYAPHKGRVAKFHAREGEDVAVNGLLAEFEEV
ncbi:MAG: lipoyl domain-containing protein [bacterium]